MKVVAKLPNAGLANKLLVWSKAVMFAVNRNLKYNDVTVYPWVDFHLKRIITRNKDQRLYLKYFKTNDFTALIKSLFFGSNIITDPAFDADIPVNSVCRFSEVPSKEDYFKYIRGCENTIKEAFFEMINPVYLENVNSYPEYDVAIHVRRGDFPKDLQLSDELVKSLIQLINNLSNKELRIFIFSDGTEAELSDILKFSNVKLIKDVPAIVDMLLISKAKLIIPSIRSTFSYFASYISEAYILRHRQDSFSPIRLEGNNEYWYSIDDDSHIHLPKQIKEYLLNIP